MDLLNIIQKIDNNILVYIADNFRDPFFDKVMIMITSFGNLGLIWILISLSLILNKKYRKVGIMTLAALLFSSIMGEGIIKHIVRRPRPFMYLPAVNLLIQKPLSYSFPSGHSMSSFAAAGILTKYIKSYALEFWTIAVLIAFSRLYLYVHYPSDVIAGALLGLLCSRLIIFIFNRFSKGE